jgi:hypothetical protein
MPTEDELEITLADFYHPFPLALKNSRKLEDIKLTTAKLLPNTLIASEPVYIQDSKIRLKSSKIAQEIAFQQPHMYCATGFLLLNEDSVHTLSASTGVYRQECLELLDCSNFTYTEDLIDFFNELLAKDEPVLIPLVENKQFLYFNHVNIRFVKKQMYHSLENKASRIDVLVVEIPGIGKYGITTEQQMIKKEY